MTCRACEAAGTNIASSVEDVYKDPCPAAAARWCPCQCPVHVSSFLPCAFESQPWPLASFPPNLLSHLAGLGGFRICVEFTYFFLPHIQNRGLKGVSANSGPQGGQQETHCAWSTLWTSGWCFHHRNRQTACYWRSSRRGNSASATPLRRGQNCGDCTQLATLLAVHPEVGLCKPPRQGYKRFCASRRHSACNAMRRSGLVVLKGLNVSRPSRRTRATALPARRTFLSSAKLRTDQGRETPHGRSNIFQTAPDGKRRDRCLVMPLCANVR